ncbi:MAG: hypothetical protein AB7Q29_11750 [Vicinamibacterales bacterium]
MTAGHFIFIPAVLLVGLVIGWILGSRAARDAYAAELRRREERAARKEGRTGVSDRPAAGG